MSPMRLLLASTLFSPSQDSVKRLRAALGRPRKLVKVHDDLDSTSTYADPEVEVIVGSQQPSNLAKVPLKVASGPFCRVIDLTAEFPPWDKWRPCCTIPIGEYVTGTSVFPASEFLGG